MNSTKNYIIRLTSDSKEHAITKKRVEKLFCELNKKLGGDMEIYIQTASTPRGWGTVLYGLGKKELTSSKYNYNIPPK